MLLTNREKAIIFAMYIGGDISMPKIDAVPFKLMAVCIEDDLLRECELVLRGDFSGGTNAVMQDGREYASECKLLLKDIIDITKEHANMVVRLGGNEEISDDYMPSEKEISVLVDSIWGALKDNVFDFKVADYLRSEGYALPYKGESLFELGIAHRL